VLNIEVPTAYKKSYIAISGAKNNPDSLVPVIPKFNIPCKIVCTWPIQTADESNGTWPLRIKRVHYLSHTWSGLQRLAEAYPFKHKSFCSLRLRTEMR